MTQDLIDFGGFEVAVDLDHWPAKILRALLRRHYERHELRLVSRLLKPTDHLIELGSAIGVVALGASRIVPADQITCFDANPAMVDAGRANFARNACDIAEALRQRTRAPPRTHRIMVMVQSPRRICLYFYDSTEVWQAPAL